MRSEHWWNGPGKWNKGACALGYGVLLLGMWAEGWGQQATLTGDAHVSSARPAVNSGSLSNLAVGAGFTTLLQFDLSALPAGTTSSQITRATLRVYCNRTDTSGTVSALPIASAWAESTVTWNSLPKLGPVVTSAPVGATDQFITFDVTATVQGWVSSPSSNFGLALTSDAASVQFDSKENDQTGHAPQLDISLAAGGAGSVGPQGPAGPAGATGAQGIQGVAGAVGPAGPAGGTGPIGLQGLPGAPGANGLQGPAGIQGAAGAAGLPGAAGATGAPGTPGLVYRGSYSSTENYALGDVVIFSGSSYASLAAANHGNTPGLSPEYWGLLTAQGASGAQGATGLAGPAGPQGVPGSAGPPGEKGDRGLEGVAGQAGAQGIPGTTGATGLQGPLGPSGPAGPTGLSFQGMYNSTANYGLGDGVLWQGAGWVSLVAGNHGNTPDQSPAAWAMFAAAGSPGAAGAAGAIGATGPAGRDGAAGPAGPVGAAGATGAAGSPGLVYRGGYDSTTNYAQGDVVLWGGSSYASLTPGNHGNTPSLVPSAWGMLTAQGSAGPQGIAGPAGATGAQGVTGPMGAQGAAGVQGPAGPQGPAGAQGLQGDIGATGDRGDAGAQGIAGQAGAQGIPGPAGATGAQGVAGPKGDAGAVGLVFRGGYDATVNYAAGDGVLWQGAGWVSVVASNHGNTPDQSPGFWTMFAAQGASGPAGAAGATGLTGAAGPQGVTGPAGPAGAVGATGAVGLTFQGAYSPALSYAVGDAVSFNGGSYLSLLTPNHGNAPDVSPSAWALLAAQGAVGTQGATGATGAAGAAGATGAVGAAGPQGPPVSFLGAWSSTTTYAVGAAVSYLGSSYIAVAANTYRTPDSSPAYWAVLASIGGTGVAGPNGPTGATGLQGPVGPAGIAGATGAAGPQGVVGPAGVAGATGPQGPAGPTGAAGPIGPQGTVGPAGPQGTTGVAGPAGPQGPAGAQGLTGSTGASGATGATGAPGPAGQAGAQGVAGPAGPMGPQGLTGAAGPAGTAGAAGAVGPAGPIGMNFRNAWTQGTHYSVNDAVTLGGSTYLAQAENTNQQPDASPQAWAVVAQAGGAGPTGAAGAAGAAATVTVGSVTTLPAGSAATVTNSGTAQATVLDFAIPQGAAGTGSGSGATTTTGGSSFAAMYHAVSFSTLYYAVNAPTASASENASVLAWVPRACTAVRMDVFSQQSGPVKVTLRSGTPGSMADTTLSCTPSTAGSCPATGSVSIPAGNFLDYRIDFASGTAAGVWTALECDSN